MFAAREGTVPDILEKEKRGEKKKVMCVLHALRWMASIYTVTFFLKGLAGYIS
jgi:hypothetical protein